MKFWLWKSFASATATLLAAGTLAGCITGCAKTDGSAISAGLTEKAPSTDAILTDVLDTEPKRNVSRPKAYLDESGYLYPPEMFTALYKLAGEPEVNPTFEPEIDPLPEEYQNQWYSNAVMWAAYNGVSQIYWEGGGKNSSYIAESRYGVEEDSAFSLSKYQKRLKNKNGSTTGLRVPYQYWEDEATRSDVVLSLYYYLTIYLGREANESASLDEYADWLGEDEYPDMCCMYRQSVSNEDGSFQKAWRWAVGSGVARPYADDTLRIGRWISRRTYINERGKKDLYEKITLAEYADILNRFAEYIGAEADAKSLLSAECSEPDEADPVANYPDLKTHCDRDATLLYFHSDYYGRQSILNGDNESVTFDDGELVAGESDHEMEVLLSERFRSEDGSLGFLALVNNSDSFTFVPSEAGYLDYGVLYGEEIWLGAYGYGIDSMIVENRTDKLELSGNGMYFSATASGRGSEMFRISGRGLENFVLEYGEGGWSVSGDNGKVILEIGIFDEQPKQTAIEIPENESISIQEYLVNAR